MKENSGHVNAPAITLYFDATPLALWQQSNIHRTGIGRMATQTLRALLQRDDVRVVLLCPCGMEEDVHRFVAENDWARKAEFVSSAPLSAPQTPLVRQLIYVGKKLARNVLAPLPSSLQGLLKHLSGVRPFAVYEQANDRLRQAVISRMLPGGTSLWLSCFAPVPLCISNIPGLHKHVILHDIIPLRLSGKHPFYAPCLDLMRQHVRKADRIWANSQFTKRDFLDYFSTASAGRVGVALHGGSEHMQPSSLEQVASTLSRFGLPAHTPYYTSLGTVEPRKGLLQVIQAFSRVAKERPDAHLILIGQKGWDYRNIIRESAAESRVHLTGFIPDEQIAAFLSGCLGFLYMSEYEGFGLPVVEAMACGAPVIAAASSSLPEVGGDAVLFVPPQDVTELAREMARLFDLPELRENLRSKGLARASRFTWYGFVHTILADAATNARAVNDHSGSQANSSCRKDNAGR